MQDVLLLKTGARVMIIWNVDTIDGITNGQMGELKEIVKSKDGSVDKLIIRLDNQNSGKTNRKK